MTDRPISVRIDRLVLRNVDDPGVAGIADLVAERLRTPAASDTPDGRPVPRRGRAMTEAAAERIAGEVRRRIAER